MVTSQETTGRVYELAGSSSLSYQDIADEVAKVVGRDVTYVDQSVDEYRATLEGFGMPADMAAMFAGMDPVIAKGALDSASTDLQDLIGRPSTSVSEALGA